ncbi:SusC/RagA family TonB-linked outer membrane protein [Arcticibacter sp. MXS-1]|uniref:SusC/RagA family TonB-linked outer membrane protein n=1 Tax=Arcticibacter sp. MXS-1 TaxID=3341726 RepID=UPI0035A8F6EF
MKKHLLLTQKAIRLILFIICPLLLAPRSVSGVPAYVSSARINISFRNERLIAAVQKLEIKSKAEFAYDPKVLEAEKSVTGELVFSNERLDVILSALLKNSSLTYKEERDGVITIFKAPALKQKQEPGRITGTIKDEKGDPLPGASIRIEELKLGAVSDINGKFVLSVKEGTYTLLVSYISYEPLKVAGNRVKSGETLHLPLTMKPAAGSLNEVVVVGYGTQKRENLTGAVDQVTSEVFANRPVANATQGLQGFLPNLNIVPLDGKPIQSPTMNIRGTTSIGQGGNALVLIDGVEGDPSRINPNDIESVSILKDAASAAIYGARAAFGVVLITTKAPSKDRITINYSFNQAIKRPTTLPDFVTNGYQFASMFNEAWSAWNDYSQTPQNVNKTVKFSQAYLEEFKRRNENPGLPKTEVNDAGEYVYYENTDWYKLLYKDHNSAMDHNLSFSGSTGKADFYISGRLYDQSGLFRYNSDDYKSYNLRAKGSIQALPWLRVSNNADYSSISYFNPINVGEGGGIWRNIADEGHTMAPLFNPDGTLTYSAAYTVGDLWYGKNGIDMDKRVFRNTTSFATQFIKNQLRVKGDFTFQNTDNDDERRRIQVPYSRKPGVIEYLGATTNDLQVTNRTTQYMATNIYGEYEPKIGESHYVKVLAGFNNEQSTYKGLRVMRNGIFENAKDLNLALGQSIETGGGWDQWVVRGGFYRINYGFKDRYLLELNGRYDGSSKFPSEQRWAFFPSVSAGWRLSKEPFWKIAPAVISDLKIRASWGSLGNGSIDSYMYQEKFSITQSERIMNGSRPQKTQQPNVLPAGLTWETSTTQNLGIDLALLSNKLTFTADAYIRKTTDMFTKGLSLPAVFGTKVPEGNYADLKTKGWEASLTWRDQFTLGSSPFHYDVRLTMADYTAKIMKYNNPEMRLDDYYVGQTLGEIWGFETEGFFKTKEEADAYRQAQILYKASTSGQLLPGDIKFRDLNNDGVINEGDKTVSSPGDRKIIGNTTPRYTYGINLGADWKNFSLFAFFQGVGKRDWYPGAEAGIFWGQYNRPYNKIPSWQLGKIWSEENPDSYLPRYRGYVAQNGSGELRQNQTRYLQNAAYIRLKNVQLGYTLPASLAKKAHISNIRLFVTGENLWSWSPLYKLTRDLDVENLGRSDVVTNPPDPTKKDPNDNNSGNGNNYPILKSISFGLSATL